MSSKDQLAVLVDVRRVKICQSGGLVLEMKSVWLNDSTYSVGKIIRPVTSSCSIISATMDRQLLQTLCDVT